MIQKMKIIEQRALSIGITANLLMGIIGWWVYSITNLQVLFLDANFSLVASLSCLVAIWISKSSKRKSSIFPKGQYVFEPLYAILKSILTLIILTSATTISITKIISFLRSGEGEAISIGPIILYAVSMIVICFSLSALFYFSNKKMKGVSTILKAEATASLIDGIMSAGIGIAVMLLSLLDVNGPLAFLYYIGDSLVTIILVIFSLKLPIRMIRDSFIEMAGGVVIDKNITDPIISIVKMSIPTTAKLKECTITKTGTRYNITVCLDFSEEQISIEYLRNSRATILNQLQPNYENVVLSIIPL